MYLTSCSPRVTFDCCGGILASVAVGIRILLRCETDRPYCASAIVRMLLDGAAELLHSHNMRLRVFAAILAMLGCIAPVDAQQYPVKPVRVVVPYTPGGGMDIMARIASSKLSERMGVQFVVENRAGG